MNRTLLCSAIEGLVSSRGYEFSLHDEAYYPSTLHRYPAAFLSHPEFVAIEGRKHGKITYKLSLRLAQQGAKLSPSQRKDALAEMEQQPADIFLELSKAHTVAVVKELTIAPYAEAIDHHGAIAMEAKATIVTIF